MQDFRKLLERLTDAGFEFVIVGGYAALTHGSSFLTRVLDICAVLTEQSVETLRQTLAPWNPRHRMTPERLSFLEHPVPDGPVENLYLETDVGVLDILSKITGVGGFERLKQNAEEFEIGGRTYRVMSLDDLIAAKEALGREKDRLAAMELRVIAARRERR